MAGQQDAFRLFRHLDPVVQSRLEGLAKVRTCRAGERVFLQGDSPSAFYIIASGRVKVVRVTREGDENILCVRGPGEHFCPVPLLDAGSQLGTAVAMTDLTLLVISSSDFIDLCGEYPELLALVQGDCLAEVRRLLHRLEGVTFRSVGQRVAQALLTMSQPGSRRAPVMSLFLTHQELGALVGASRESVSRVLRGLEQQGIVHLERGQITILDWERLQKITT